MVLNLMGIAADDLNQSEGAERGNADLDTTQQQSTVSPAYPRNRRG
jgi:hypothetical protein